MTTDFLPFTIVATTVGALLGVSVLLVLYRIVRGPTILDRMIASDVLLTTTIIVLASEMVVSGHADTLPVVLVLAATAIFGTIAVARSVSKQDRSERPDDPGVTDPTAPAAPGDPTGADLVDPPLDSEELADLDRSAAEDLDRDGDGVIDEGPYSRIRGRRGLDEQETR